MAAAIAGASLLARSWAARGALLAALAFGLWNATATQFRPHVPEERLADWRAACAWIRDETPRDALFLTPRTQWSFRWFAQRADYVNWKDCPQDAAGIVEWNNRLKQRSRWVNDEWNNGYSRGATDRLHAATGVTHILAEEGEPYAVEPLYRNGSYAVYRIGDAPASTRE
jgi:hypothetical protein